MAQGGSKEPALQAGQLLLFLATFLSGVAALVYEVTWVRQLGALIGSTTVAVNIVLAVFFGGLGIGAWVFGRIAGRSARPLRLFCLLEAGVAASGLLFWPALRGLDRLYISLAPADWSLAQASSVHAVMAFALLALPTICMGGTLPVLVRLLRSGGGSFVSGLAWLYGLNTVGAALGAFLSVFWLLPSFGLLGASLLAAGLNLTAIALVALAWGMRGSLDAGERVAGEPTEPPLEERPLGNAPDLASRKREYRLWLLAAAMSGLCSVGLEVLWTRALATRFMSTVYSFATILVVFLVCLGIGSVLVAGLDRRRFATPATASILMMASGVAGLLSLAALTHLGLTSYQDAGGAGLRSVQLDEFLKTLAVIGLPTLLFGMTFPVLCRLVKGLERSAERSVGDVYLANTAGSVLAPLLFGFLLIPSLGLRRAFLLVCAGAFLFGLLLPVLLPRGRTGLGRTWPVALLCLILSAGLAHRLQGGGELGLWRQAESETLLYQQDGVAASIAVVEDGVGARSLRVDNTYSLGGTRQHFGQARQGLIPLLLSPRLGRSLLIGLATGCSAGPVAAWGGPTDILEIVPGLRQTLPSFDGINEGLSARLQEDPKVRLFEADGRHYVRATKEKYETVIGDLFVPWRAGEGSMYTREHLEAVRAALSEDGIFVQWLPLYQLRAPELSIIVATFCDVFAAVDAFWLYFNVDQPVIGLVASSRALSLSWNEVQERLALQQQAPLLATAGLTDPRPFVASWIAGRETLAQWSSGSPIETQTRPRVEFASPYALFGSPVPPAAENVPIVIGWTQAIEQASFLRDASAAQTEELARYQRSLRLFFEAGHATTWSADPVTGAKRLQAALAETPDWQWIVWNMEQLARRALAARRFDISADLAQALQEAPGQEVFGLYLAAVTKAQQGQREEAVALVSRALALEPQHAGAQALLQELER